MVNDSQRPIFLDLMVSRRSGNNQSEAESIDGNSEGENLDIYSHALWSSAAANSFSAGPSGLRAQ